MYSDANTVAPMRTQTAPPGYNPEPSGTVKTTPALNTSSTAFVPPSKAGTQNVTGDANMNVSQMSN